MPKCFATEGELTMKATEAVAGWRSGRRARVGCFKFKSILSFPCGRRVSDMRVLLVTHCEWLFIYINLRKISMEVFHESFG